MSEAAASKPTSFAPPQDDRWTDSLRRHLTECDDCVATAAVAPWMSRFARISDREHILPDPSVVWLKAKLLQGTVDVGRVSRPLNIVQMLAYLVVAGGWAGSADVEVGRGRSLDAQLHPDRPGRDRGHAAESLSMSFFALVFVLASMTVMLALHTILAEE